MNNWVDVIGVLGRGSCAVVSLATLQCYDGTTGLIAIKSPNDPASSWMIERESSILGDFIGCPQIIQCFGNVSDIVVDNYGNLHEICDMYMEYAPYGSLESHINSGPLPEKQVCDYTKSILKGLAHVHRKGYVHCDIKPANILVWGPSDVKITDFGLAKLRGHKAEGFGEYGIRCTPQYMAPECVARGEYESPLDIWSLGCTVVEMLTGMPAIAFDDDYAGDLGKFLEAIGSGIAVPKIPKTLSQAGKNFLELCFFQEPARRWSAKMLLNHPFVSDRSRGLWSDDSFGFRSDYESYRQPIGCGNFKAEDAELDQLVNSMIAMMGI